MRKKGIFVVEILCSFHVYSQQHPSTMFLFLFYKGTFSIMPTAPSLPTVKMISPRVFVAKPASQ